MVHDLMPVWDEATAETRGLFTPGEVVSDLYVIRAAVGRGRGEVYEADDLALDRQVAIKTMAAVGANVDGALLRREAQALAALHHPSLLTVHGLGVHRGIPYLVMERLFGLSLAELVARERARGRRLAVRDAVEILVRIADGLAVVHDAGIAHGELSAEGVMVCGGGRAVLVDLGAMAACGDDDVRADVRGFGVVAHELLVGAPPPPSISDEAAPAIARTDVPARLAAVVRACLAPAPAARPSCMEQIAWELRASVRARPVHH
jgi:serine/threonine-protein kinase